jgi:hypothetical protein
MIRFRPRSDAFLDLPLAKDYVSERPDIVTGETSS